MKQKLKVCWISAGVSSFIAGYLAENVDEFIYIDIENQHPDSMRFIKDCEKALKKPIQILKSNYGNTQNVIRQFQFINGIHGAKCTEVLKKGFGKNGSMNIKTMTLHMFGNLISVRKTGQTGYWRVCRNSTMNFL